MLVIPDKGGCGGNHLGIPTGFLLVPIQGPFFKMGPDLLERGGIGAARQQSPCHQVGIVGVASSAFTGLGPIGVDRVEKLHSFGKRSLRGLGFIRFVGGELDYRGIGHGNLGLNGSGLIKDGFGIGWDGGFGGRLGLAKSQRGHKNYAAKEREHTHDGIPKGGRIEETTHRIT